MTDQLAQKIEAMEIPDEVCDDTFDAGFFWAQGEAAAIARAWQPVVAVKPEWSYFQGLVNIAFRSAAKAKIKFPQPNYVTLKIAEEAGEVVRGAVHYAEGRMEWDEVQGEIVQLLAMLIRFVTEGDEVNGVIPPARILSAITVGDIPAPDPVIKPDPLGAEWMREMAISHADYFRDVAGRNQDGDFYVGEEAALFGTSVANEIAGAIHATPGPTDADLDRAALARPVVRELVDAADKLAQQFAMENPMRQADWQGEICQCRRCMFDKLSVALAKIGGAA